MVDTYDYIIKKYNITIGKQYFIEIPQMIGSVDLAKLFAELGFTQGVEIGTDQGVYAEILLKTIPNLHLDCIDPWKAGAYERGQQPESKEKQEFFDSRYQETKERLKPYEDKMVDIFRMTSMEALKEIEDNSSDFVYIDGNHDFINVAQDMHYWLKKVRPGGILAGHDYVRYPSRKFNHVQKVVNAYMTTYHLLPVFLVTPTNKGLKRDRYRSWFIVKPSEDPITHKPYGTNNN
jgi:hypothetical protein